MIVIAKGHSRRRSVSHDRMLERTTRFELAATCLEGRCSTIELRPLILVTTIQGRSCVSAGYEVETTLQLTGLRGPVPMSQPITASMGWADA